MSRGVILCVGNFELPDRGASANRVVSNAKLFNQLGYQTVLLGVAKDKSCTKVRELKNNANVLMYERPYPDSTMKWFHHMYSADYIEEMLKLHGDIVLVILYNMPFSALKAAKRVCKKRSIKVAYDCTEWTDVTDGNAVKRFVKRHDEKLIRNKLADVADGLIVISSIMENQYSGCSAMIKLPPLVDTGDRIWHQLPERHEWFEFCFAGMLDGQKDSLDLIVSAFANICDKKTKLRIIGVKRDEFISTYPDAESSLDNCGKSVIFMGMQSHSDTIKYVLGCDCYVFIRQSDLRNNAGFPTKFVEATTCGVQMITTNVSDIKAFADENVTVLDLLNEREIAAAMNGKKTGPNSNRINNRFDYRSYKEEASHWIAKILNGGETDAGKT